MTAAKHKPVVRFASSLANKHSCIRTTIYMLITTKPATELAFNINRFFVCNYSTWTQLINNNWVAWNLILTSAVFLSSHASASTILLWSGPKLCSVLCPGSLWRDFYCPICRVVITHTHAPTHAHKYICNLVLYILRLEASLDQATITLAYFSLNN